jgi:uncharacterized protein (UPF0332 family)
MEAWERWWRMAQGSFAAAQSLEKLSQTRSCASRAYYAAYQAATASLLYGNQIPPVEREAWSHEATPALLENVPSRILTPRLQQDLETRLADLYVLRLTADYRSEADIEAVESRSAVRSAAFILKTIGSIFPRN